MTCKYCNDTGSQESPMTGQLWECLECKPKFKSMPFGSGKYSIPGKFSIKKSAFAQLQDSLKMARNNDEFLEAIIAIIPEEKTCARHCVDETVKDILKYYGSVVKYHQHLWPNHLPMGIHPPTDQYSVLVDKPKIRLLAMDMEREFTTPFYHSDSHEGLVLKADSYKLTMGKVFEKFEKFRQIETAEVLMVGGEATGHTVRNEVVDHVPFPNYFIGPIAREVKEEIQDDKVKMVTSDEILKNMDEQTRQIRDFFFRPAPLPQASAVTIIVTDGPEESTATPAQLKLAARDKWWDDMLIK